MSQNQKPIRIVHLEDNARDSAMIRDLLESEKQLYEIRLTSDRKQFEEALFNSTPDVILCDFSLPNFNAYAALELAKEKLPETPVIIISGSINAEEAVECLRKGATDYLFKQRLERLPSAIQRATHEAEEHQRRRLAEEELAAAHQRTAILAKIGRDLTEAATPRAAALFVLQAARQLIDWDSGWLQLWNEEKQQLENLAHFDLIDGERKEIPLLSFSRAEPSPAARRAMQEGPQLVLREDETANTGGYVLFGNNRRSLSLMYVPIRLANRCIGVLSIHSYRRHAYDQAALDLLQNLADHCAGTLARIQSRAALAASEERFRMVWEGAADGMRLTDIEGRIVAVNPAFCRIMGIAKNEIEGQFLSKLYDDVEGARIMTSIREQFIHRRVRSNQPQFRKLWDGRQIWLEVSSCFIDSDPARPLLLSIFRDSSERVQTDQAAREFLATLDVMVDGAFIFDPNTLRFSYVNEGAVRQLGYSREEFLQMTTLDIIPQFDEWQFRELIEPLRKGERQIFNFTSSQRRKDNTEIPVDINLQYVAPEGGRPRFIAISRDITERKRVESQLLRTQRLESIGNLAGGVAHDLNNALAPILMSIELLRAEAPGSEELIDTIATSAQRGADMVRQLLTFAKGTTGERLLIEPLRLFKEMEKIVKSTFPKVIQLRTDYGKDIQTIKGDATQLHQVLLNLCVNARDAMPNGGTLTLEVENKEIDASFASTLPEAKPGTYVVFRVVDTGTGIPPAMIERIFEPFFSTKGADKGTGLGLSTVIGIVKGHGGFVRVYSVQGQGSTFAIYLPAAGSGTGDTILLAKVNTTFRGHGETVLVVDDEPAVRQVARAVLVGLNFKVITAADGTEALMHAAEHRADLRLIITDLHMPNMDGLTFVRVIKRMLPNAGIIVASGRMDPRAAEEFKGLGVNTLLDKPFTQEKLVEAVKLAFGK